MTRISLRTVVISLIVLLCCGSFYLFGQIAFDTFDHVVEDSSRTLFREINRNVQQRIQSTLSRGPLMVEELAELHEYNLLQDQDEKVLWRKLVVRLVSEPFFAELGYYDASQNRLTAVTRHKNEITVRQLTCVDGVSDDVRYKRDKTGNWVFLSRQTSPYDPTTRPWYKIAAKSNGTAWSPFYEWASGGRGISCVRAVRKQGKVVGIFTADFNVSEMKRFLDSFQVARTGQVFILDEAYQIIVGPGNVQADYPEALESLGKESVSGSVVSGRIRWKDRDFLIETQPFKIGDSLTFRTALIVPDSEIFGSVYRIWKNSVYLALFAIVLIVVIGVFMAGFVTSPLRQISTALNRISNFEFSIEEEEKSSVIYEIDSVRQSYYAMTKSLRSFEKYVPKALVRQLIREGRVAEVGGTRKVLTLHFSDLAGFTGLSEGQQAEEIVDWLSDYLTDMTLVLQQHGGTIDKFMGDGILGFFNAPNDLPGHANKACHAALAAQQFLAEQREKRRAEGITPVLYTRIGLHTGEVIVGNIGTPERFAYTVIGDAVNLASRLEGLNKAYGTEILVSEQTQQAATDSFKWRKLDKVAVVGRKEGVVVYELLGTDASTISEQQLTAYKNYEEALQLYWDRKFPAALELIQNSLKDQNPRDKASEKLEQHILAFIDAPPPDDWDGVYRAKSK